MEEPIKIILAEDKAQYRKVIKEIIEPYNIIVLADAENGEECLKLLDTKKPDIILLDLEMPVMDGNTAFSILCKKYPAIKVIILSLHFEPLLIENYIERGAKGYLPKDAIMGNPILLINAIRKVYDNGIFIFEKPEKKNNYSNRQKEILPLIFEGKTNDEIAKEIGITKRAVEKQKQKIYQKSGAEKIIDFYKYAFSKGLQFLGRNKKS